jgi:multiple sugar transport system substrate-binding protein
VKRIMIGFAATALIAAACTAGGGGNTAQTVNPSVSHAPVTLTVWDYYTERELTQLKDVLDQFHQKFPWITLNIVPGKSFNDYVRGINSGQSIDVAIDAGPDNVGKYCSSGAFRDLAPDLQASGVDLAKTFPPAALKYTSYNGVQCTLPLLTDAYGLYYNKAMFAKANISAPPKTLTEFSDDVHKLTQFNPDGSIKVAGFVPLSSFYENPNLFDGLAWGATWYQSNGQSAFATDPKWGEMLQWQKQLVDFLGYQNLSKLFAQIGGPNSEWSSAQAFETGKVAMLYDGEWRNASILADKAKISYGTAPFPTADDMSSIYGAGRVGGTVVGIPRTVQHPAEAWELVRFLTTDTNALTTLANELQNVPSTYDSLKDPVLANNPLFNPFLGIFSNPNSHFYQLNPAGTAAPDALTAFQDKWEAGSVPDLQAGLQQLANSVDQQLQLG